MNFHSDIPLETARVAHLGTSFSPELRAEQEREDYAQTLRGDLENFGKIATTDSKRATLETEFARYREGYKTRFLAYLGARGRRVSTMVTGRSGFNTRRAEKCNLASDRRLADLIEYRERALKAIRRELQPELAPIMAGDDDACSRLKAKITKERSSHATTKAANAIIRRKPKNQPTPEKLEALEALKGISFHTAADLFTPDFAGRIGFPSYILTKRNANIRRMQDRLSGLERAKAQPSVEIDGTEATFEDDPPANRVRVRFPGKPSSEIRSILKAAGFRWAPSIGAWQAYRNYNSIETAKTVAGIALRQNNP